MGIAEEAHEAGREGVMDVKRWLESTMRFEVRYTVYDQPVRVTLPLLNGKSKRFDMLAQHYKADAEHSPSGRDVYVEVKNVHTLNSARKQSKQYKAFVATAYSATRAGALQLGRDPEYEFMWATRHPWEVEHFIELTTGAFVKEALSENDALLGGDTPDASLADEIANRLWIWHIPTRQDEMTMGPVHRGYVLSGVLRQQ